MSARTWSTDVLGDGYEALTIPLGADPDGEGDVEAVLVRRGVRDDDPAPVASVLYVHGFSDYFFQREMADWFAARGYAFFALDLRKCGRARRDAQTAHYVSDLALYDAELEAAHEIVRDETGGLPLLLSAHSTGGLILPLWLDRRRRAGRPPADDGVLGLVLNSPWFDLQGSSWMRTIGTRAIGAVSRVRPNVVISRDAVDAYGTSLHVGSHGEWEFDLALKPNAGFPITTGWITAIRRGHARLHRGLDVGVPSLVLRSARSHFARTYRAEVDTADAVLDVRQIARWSGCLGNAVTSLPIDGARHDVFLSKTGPREVAYGHVDTWLTTTGLPRA